MIQAFQKFSQSRIAKIFLAIVALSFMVFFGGGNWFRSHDPNAVVAEVGGVSINRYEFAEKLQRAAAQSQESMTREELLKSGLPQMVLSQLIQETLLNLEAEHLGLMVSDETLRHRIQSIKAFQNEQGVFDRTHFAQILRTNGLSEEAFIGEVRQELAREQLINAIIVGAYLPEEMVDRLFDAQYQHRQAAMLTVSRKAMPVPPPPPSSTLEAFYKDHLKDFETPELRTFTSLIIDPTAIAKDISVTEEEIKTAYESKPEAFGKKPLENVKPLVIAEVQKEKSVEKAYQVTQELDDKIAGGATFEELASTLKGAQLATFDAIDAQGRDRMETPSPKLPKNKELTQEILQTAFSLEENMDSPFTQARNGVYYTIRVDKISPAASQPFTEIKDRVLKVWSETEQLKAAYSKAEEYVKSFNQGNRKASLMMPLPNLSLSESAPSVSSEVKNLVFSLRPERAGMTLTSEGFAVVILNKIIPPSPKVKEEKMALFTETLLKHYQNDLLMAYLNALRIRYPVKTNREAIKVL